MCASAKKLLKILQVEMFNTAVHGTLCKRFNELFQKVYALKALINVYGF